MTLETQIDDLGGGELFAVIIIGMAVGYIGGYCGIGGAPFMVSLLLLTVDMCQHLAQGTVLAVMLPPMSLMAALAMKDRVKVLWKITVPAFFGYAICSYAGASLAFLMDNSQLSYFFGAFLICVGIRYGKQFILAKLDRTKVEPKATLETDPETNSPEITPEDVPAVTTKKEGLNPDGITIQEGATFRFNYVGSGALGSVVGVVGGLFGIGAGVLMVPLMTELFAVHKDDARTLSLLILLPPVSIGAIVKYEQEDSVDWAISGLMFFLYFCTNYTGAKAGRKAKAATFKMVMGMCLAILGTMTILMNKYRDEKPECK